MAAEKKPLNALLKVVGNFFTKGQEKADTMLAEWEPVHDAYIGEVKAERERKMQEEVERQRKEEEAKRAEAERLEHERKAAEEAAAEARRKEAEEREKAEKAKREREEAERRAEELKAEERRLEKEKADRDRAEKEKNTQALRDIRRYLKDAEKLHALSETEEASEEELKLLDGLIRHGGTISLLAGPVASSHLLDDEQRTEIELVRGRLNEMRESANKQFNKREQKRREKEAKEAEEREAKLAAERKARQEEEDRKLAETKAKREEEERRAATAKAEKEASEKAARESRQSARESESEARDAGKGVAKAGLEADRAANRADRAETRLENTTEAELSRTRGDFTTAGQQRHWKHYITDEDALRGAIQGSMKLDHPQYAILVSLLAADDLNGAVYRYMMQNYRNWTKRERVDDVLAGVSFVYELDTKIRT